MRAVHHLLCDSGPIRPNLRYAWRVFISVEGTSFTKTGGWWTTAKQTVADGR